MNLNLKSTLTLHQKGPILGLQVGPTHSFNVLSMSVWLSEDALVLLKCFPIKIKQMFGPFRSGLIGPL